MSQERKVVQHELGTMRTINYELAKIRIVNTFIKRIEDDGFVRNALSLYSQDKSVQQRIIKFQCDIKQVHHITVGFVMKSAFKYNIENDLILAFFNQSRHKWNKLFDVHELRALLLETDERNMLAHKTSDKKELSSFQSIFKKEIFEDNLETLIKFLISV